MITRVVFTERARKDLRKLETKTAQAIISKIEYYANQEDPMRFAKRLKSPYRDRLRFRIGDYRAIFAVGKDGEIQLLLILSVKHRKQVYE